MASTRTRLESNFKAIGARSDGPRCKMARQLQAKHQNRLQAKLQIDINLLDDMRDYFAKRSKLDQDYAQGLAKLATQCLRQRDWKESVDEIADCTILGSFKTVLEETQATAEAMKGMADTLVKLGESIAAEMKQRATMVKKLADSSASLQTEFETIYRECDKAKKNHDEMGAKHSLAKAKLESLEGKKRRGLVLFQDPRADEQRRSKTSDRLSIAWEAAAASKNNLILTSVALTAFEDYYNNQSFPELLADMDGNVYNNVKIFLTSYVQAQKGVATGLVGSCQAVEERLAKINKESVEKALLSLWKEQTVPMQTGDTGAGLGIEELCTDAAQHSKLNKALHRAFWERDRANKALAPHSTTMATVRRQTAAELTSGLSNTESLARQDAMIFDAHIDALGALWTISRTTAVIDVLSDAGFDVPQDGPEGDADSRSITSSTLSRQGSSGNLLASSAVRPGALARGSLVECRVLYAYAGSMAEEELTIEVDEVVFAVEKALDGWIKVRNTTGQEGYVPEAYIEAVGPASPAPMPMPPRPVSMYNIVQPEQPPLARPRTAIALYDYEADTADELSFSAGDVIMVLQTEGQVDDGYWRGMLKGKVGAFPAMVVELQD